MRRIRNWTKYQHYKPMHSKYKKQMTWLKLYGGDILNDIEWFELTDTNKAIYIELLCLASQNHGNLPENKEIAFRLRRPIEQVEMAISDLSQWIEDGIYSVYTMPILEEEKEKEKETISKEFLDESFKKWWSVYPNKKGKAEAEKLWKKHKLYDDLDNILKYIKAMDAEWKKTDKKYILHGDTFLRKRRWEDEVVIKTNRGRIL